MKIKRIDKHDGKESIIAWTAETFRQLRASYAMPSSEMLKRLEGGGILQTAWAIYSKDA